MQQIIIKGLLYAKHNAGLEVINIIRIAMQNQGYVRKSYSHSMTMKQFNTRCIEFSQVYLKGEVTPNKIPQLHKVRSPSPVVCE